MARQAFVVLIALALLATVAFGAEAEASKASLPVFAPVPTGTGGPTAVDSNEIGTVGGIAGDAAAGAPLASGPSIADVVTAAGVGGPVADGVFKDSAESPKSGATTVKVSAVTVAAVAAASLLF